MPKEIKEYSVFIGSPSDTNPEREAIKDIIEELNHSSFKNSNIRLNLLSWEKSVYPSFGDYPQQVVNEHIGNDYDIFVGILWSKFGTPTKKFGSGTEEEFRNAYERHKNGEKIPIMFYFKKDNVDIFKEDFDFSQIEKIKKFKSDLIPLGGLYSEFKSTDEFKELIRVHLNQSVLQLNSNNNITINNSPTLTTNNEIEDNFDEYGIFELDELGSESFKITTSILEEINKDIREIGDVTKTKTERLEKINNSKNSAKSILAKGVIDDIAEYLIVFSDKLNRNTSLYKTNFKNGIMSYAKMYELNNRSQMLNEEQKESYNSTIHTLISTFQNGIKSMEGFLESIKRLPDMTSKLKIGKKESISSLDNFIKELKNGEMLLINAIIE